MKLVGARNVLLQPINSSPEEMKACRVAFIIFSNLSKRRPPVSQKSECPHNPELQTLGPVVAGRLDGLENIPLG